jgi:aminodeoxyfutalosine deaminase
MSLKTYVQAMPKADVYVQLEGAMRRHVLLMIAEQNNMPETVKRYTDWIAQIDKPDPRRLTDLVKMTSSWLQIADDVKRLAYDLGVSMHHQNIRYAEVVVTPSLYDALGLPLETLFEALNDGRDRAERGWDVKMNWIIAVGREEPRRADEYIRFASSIAGNRGRVVGVALTGKEDAQPVGQFERAFRSAEKKEVNRVVRAGDVLGAEGVNAALSGLAPNRIIDARGIADAPDVLAKLAEARVGVAFLPTRALKAEWAADMPALGLRTLLDAGVRVTFASDMPSLYRTTLADEYAAAVEKAELSVSEMEDLALNAVRMSFLPPEERDAMLNEFTRDYAKLRAEHLEAAGA